MRSISLDETIQQLGRTLATLSVWLAGLSPAAWQSPEAPDAWSPSKSSVTCCTLKRRANLAILAGLQISPDTLARTATHPELGEVTLGQLLACWVTHDLAHTAQAARGLVRYRGDHVGP
jgi:hypothetical protein